MFNINKQNIVFHYYKGSIRAYSYVIEEAPKDLKPRPNQNDSTEGYLVKVKITDLNPEIALEEIPEEYKKNAIFTKNGFPRQGYLFPVYDQLTEFLSNQISMITGETKELIKIPEDYYLVEPFDWRDFLQKWRKNNSIITPPNLVKIRDEFKQRFPKEKLDQLNLEDYALGNPDVNPHSFCQFIEFEAKELVSIEGSFAIKYGVYWSKEDNNWRWDKFFQSPTAVFEQIKKALIDLVKTTEQGKLDELDNIADQFLVKNRNSLRGSPLYFPLYLYYPDKFIPIFSTIQLSHWLDFFDFSPLNRTLADNLILFNNIKSLPEFQGFDSWGMMRFLYDLKEELFSQIEQIKCLEELWEKSSSNNQNMFKMKELMPLYTWEQLKQETGYQSIFLERLERTLKRKKQIVLTGCPGSGKTYLADKLAQYLTSESDGFIELIQFHPAYTYEDFMQGLRPLADNENNLTYQIVAGRFLEFCE